MRHRMSTSTDLVHLHYDNELSTSPAGPEHLPQSSPALNFLPDFLPDKGIAGEDRVMNVNFVRQSSLGDSDLTSSVGIVDRDHEILRRTSVKIPCLYSEGRKNNQDCSFVSLNGVETRKQGSYQVEEPPIVKAILAGDHRLVLERLRLGDNPDYRCPTSGRSLLHLVTSSCRLDDELAWVPMVYQLSNAGADLDSRDKQGHSPVGLAIGRRLVEILSSLLKCGAGLSNEDVYHVEQIKGVVKTEMTDVIRRLTPSYWSAVLDPAPFKVSRLVKAWSRVNISKGGKTLIEFAKQKAHDPAMVQLLLQHEASIELAHAVMAGDVSRVRVLLCDAAADTTIKDTSARRNHLEPLAPMTLIGVAAKLGHSDVLAVLHATDARRLTPGGGGGDKRAGEVGPRAVTVRGSSYDDAPYSGRGNVTSALCQLL